jgi:hypothetical protein
MPIWYPRLYTEVRRLSRGRALQLFRVTFCFGEVLKKRGDSLQELEDPVCLRDFAFFVVKTEKLNILNLELPVKDEDIGETISDVASFTKNL